MKSRDSPKKKWWAFDGNFIKIDPFLLDLRIAADHTAFFNFQYYLSTDISNIDVGSWKVLSLALALISM
jgi:hypothetical protein